MKPICALLLAGLPLAVGCSGGHHGGSPTPTPTPAPTKAGLHVSWTLRGAVSGSALTCLEASAATVDVLSTCTTNVALSFDHSFACTLGTADALDYAFGSYSTAIQALDSGGLSLGPATNVPTTLGPSPCDRLVSGQCVKDVPAVVYIDGK